MTKTPKVCTKCNAPWLRMSDIMFCRYCENVYVIKANKDLDDDE